MTEIRLLVVYDRPASEYWSHAGLTEAIGLAVDETNALFERSGALVEVSVSDVRFVDYTGTTNSWVEAQRLRRSSDGHLDDVHTLRDATESDLVLYVSGTLESCGAATTPNRESDGWLMVDRYRADSSTIMSELVARSLGTGQSHDGTFHAGSFPYSNAYRYTVGDVTFATAELHSHESYDERVPYLSTPLRSHEGIPVGDATHDNVRTINELRGLVAAYRPLWIQPDLSISRRGTARKGVSVYDAGAMGQRIRLSVGRREASAFSVFLNLHGNTDDELYRQTVRIQGSRSGNGVSVRYFDYESGANVTRAVKDGSYEADLVPSPPEDGYWLRLRVQVTVARNAVVGARQMLMVTSTSDADPPAIDTVGALVTVG